MIPWNMLPKDLQKSLLVMIVISGSATASGCCPMVCDPPPPPPTTPKVTPSMTPMIFDPPPPPAITRGPTSRGSVTPMICDPPPPPAASRTPKPGAFITPMICDPAPPPSATQQTQHTVTPAALNHFQLHSLQMIADETLSGAAVKGRVSDRTGNPLGEIRVCAQINGTVIETWSSRSGEFFLSLANPGHYTLVVGDDQGNAIPLSLNRHDLAVVEWEEVAGEPESSLPLAEIRTVDLVWGNSLTFSVESPWGQARYRWSVSGGTLEGEGEQVVWEPPTETGRYLLQLIADWGRTGLAVDSIVLTVHDDGSVSVS